MKINPIPPQRDYIVDSTYIASSGFTARLAETLRKLEIEDAKEAKRIVESNESARDIDFKV